MGEDYYDILGISATASSDEIKQAYLSLAKQYHPDSNPSSSAHEYFLIIQKGYETLSNSKKRREYDLLRQQPEHEQEYLSITSHLSATEIPVNSDPQLVYALLDIKSPVSLEKIKPIPVHLCFVIDCSTSMKGSRIEMVKESLLKCIKDLSAQDLISIVSFNDFAKINLAPTRITDMEKIGTKIRELNIGGGTEIFKGLKAGVDLLWEGGSNINNRHLILMTDGHTYGDEQACFQLLNKAREQGITLTSFGFGNDWNDKFLDQLANLTGGSSEFIFHREDLYNYIKQLTSSTKTIYAHNACLEIISDKQVRLKYVFRIEPSVAELGVESPIVIGDLQRNKSTKMLLAFQIDNALTSEIDFRLASGFVKAELASTGNQKIRKGYKISVKIRENLTQIAPPLDILNAISRITMYQMQDKVRSDVHEGDINQAVKRLENMASRLLVEGNQPLANILIREADHVNKVRAFSSDGEKRIKYGTRALLQLPPPMKREE